MEDELINKITKKIFFRNNDIDYLLEKLFEERTDKLGKLAISDKEYKGNIQKLNKLNKHIKNHIKELRKYKDILMENQFICEKNAYKQGFFDGIKICNSKQKKE